MMEKIYKPLLFTLGILCLILAVIGAFLPIVPTTPFALLAAFLFSKSSKRMHDWMLRLPILGPAILDWREHHVIGMRAKCLMVPMLATSFYFISLSERIPLWVKMTVITILSGVLIFVLTRPSRPSKPREPGTE